MPPHIVRYPPIQCNTRERCDQLQIPAAPPAWRVPEGPDNLAAVPMGGGRAWPGFDGKLHHTQRHKRRRCGGRRRVRRARLRCPWAVAGPGRASSRHTTAQAPPVRRAPEGPKGQAAVPVGGGGAWPDFEGKLHHTQPRKHRRCGGCRRARRARAGFEIDHSERSSRVAISRAAGPDGARNTRGA